MDSKRSRILCPELRRSTPAQIAALNFDRPYQQVLDHAWRMHLAPKSKLTVVSTFAGAGGSSLGYSIAGLYERLAVEWDNHAVNTFKHNFSGVPVFHGDITTLNRKKCFSLTGLAEGELDVLDGSPPCQGFSTAGKRKLDDERNYLFLAFSKLLGYFKPRVFVMENVRGLVLGKMRTVYEEILRTLKAHGHKVEARIF